MSIADIAKNIGPAVVSVRADGQIGTGMIYDAVLTIGEAPAR